MAGWVRPTWIPISFCQSGRMKESEAKPSTPSTPDEGKTVRQATASEAKEPNRDSDEEGAERELPRNPRKYPKPLR